MTSVHNPTAQNLIKRALNCILGFIKNENTLQIFRLGNHNISFYTLYKYIAAYVVYGSLCLYEDMQLHFPKWFLLHFAESYRSCFPLSFYNGCCSYLWPLFFCQMFCKLRWFIITERKLDFLKCFFFIMHTSIQVTSLNLFLSFHDRSTHLETCKGLQI